MWRAQFLICQKDDQSPFITLLGAAAASARGAERSPPELEHLAVEHDLGVIPAGVRHAELPLFFVANSDQHVLSFERVGLWRLADVFDAAGVKATVALNSQVCEVFPKAIEEIKKRFKHGGILRRSGVRAASASPDSGDEPSSSGRQAILANTRKRARATSSDCCHEPGYAGRGRFAPGCAEPDPRRPHRAAVGVSRNGAPCV